MLTKGTQCIYFCGLYKGQHIIITRIPIQESLLSQYCTVLCNMPVADNLKKSVLLHCIYEWCHKYINVVNVVINHRYNRRNWIGY